MHFEANARDWLRRGEIATCSHRRKNGAPSSRTSCTAPSALSESSAKVHVKREFVERRQLLLCMAIMKGYVSLSLYNIEIQDLYALYSLDASLSAHRHTHTTSLSLCSHTQSLFRSAHTLYLSFALPTHSISLSLSPHTSSLSLSPHTLSSSLFARALSRPLSFLLNRKKRGK